MKHSIKREQSHARMSFVECENQRSLAEGESNVRATLKHMKLSFHLILTLAAMLTMAQTAWAADETKTFENATIQKGNTGQLTYNGEILFSAVVNETVRKSTSSGQVTLLPPINDAGEVEEGTVRFYPHISGKVKSIVFSSAYTSTAGGYMKIGKGSTWTNSVSETMTGNNPWTSISFTNSNGIQLDNEGDYLEIKLFGTTQDGGGIISKGSITVTYEPTAATLTHTHDFSYSKNSNTLTVTCAHNDGKTCDLASSNYQATLTLSPPVDTYYRLNTTYSATLNLGPFNALTGLNATATDITYVNNTTSDNLGSTAPTTAGNYTASVTVTVGGKDYTLSTDFKVNAENSINNNIRQISVSKTSAANDEEITITFTPRSHELVNTLTVTGATTNKSIGNGITKVDEYTYTFTMPFEEVTIGATFKSSDASLYKYAITTDITGSGAVDYNAEEYLGAGDAITITFMPYLQGNLEAGSVVLEGLTVTGATTSMSVGNGITDNGNNTYTFTMPGENVTVTAKAYLSADAILAGTINEPIYIKQGNGIQIGCNNKWTYVNDGALPLVIPDGNTLRLAGGTDVRLDLADKNAIACEGDAIVELIPNEVSNDIGIGDRPERNSGKATIKVGPAGKTLTIRVADESTETVHLTVKSISQCDRNCDVIGCDEGGSCGSIVVESGQVESREYFNDSGRAFRTTDGTITFGYKYPNDEIIFDGGSEGTVKIEDGKQFHSYYDYNTKYSGTINLQGINYFYARPDKYIVTFDENGGSDVDNQTVVHGMKATEPATTREGFTFVCWKNGEDAYDFNTVVTSDLTLTAGWKRPITSEGISITIPSQVWTGSELTPVITVTDGETELTLNTDYTVTAPSGTVQNTGNYTYTITGAGNYSGEFTAIFKIVPKSVTIDGVSGGPLSITQDQNGYTATIDGTSETDLNITTTVTVKDVKISREFHSGQASTVILPFDYTCNDSEGGKFYAFVGVAWNDSENKWEATMKEPGDDTNQVTTLTANTPYLFMPSGTEMTFPNIPNMAGGTVTLKPASEGGNCSGTSGDGNWQFHGTYTKKTWTASDSDKDYGFAATSGTATDGTTAITAGQFVRFTPGAWMKPMRCYLSYVGTSAPAPARGMTRAASVGDDLPQSITVRLVSRGGDTTAIGTLDTKTGELSFDGWYTMDGRKLDGKPTKRGLYINNGRKIVIK